MDETQKVLVRAGRKDLAQEYYKKIAVDSIHPFCQQLVREINKQLSFIGILGVKVSEKDISDDEKFKSVKKINIDPKLVGPLSSVFEKIDVEIKVACSSELGIGEILLKYRWKHPRGTNGYTVRLRYDKNKWKDIS